MKNRDRAVLMGCSLAAAGVATLLSGCSDPPPPPPPPPAPVYTPPPPPVKTVADLASELNIDPRVRLSDTRAPRTEEERRAVLTFFDSFARGNDTRLREMLEFTDQDALEDIITSGRWQGSVNGIEEIQIQTGPSPQGRLAVLAMFTVDGELQPTMWYLDDAAAGGIFEAAYTPPDIMHRIYGDDLILAWHQVIDDELERSDDPDFEIRLPQEILGQPGAPGTPGQPTAPGGPGGPGNDPMTPPSSPGGTPGGPGPGAPI
jgi:hypothetical protein